MSFMLRKKLGAAIVLITLMASSSYAAPQNEGVWSEPFEFDWPVEASHILTTPQGNVLTIGGNASVGGYNNQLTLDVWDPKLGTGESSHRTIVTDITAYLFSYKSVLLPDSNKVLIAGSTEPGTSTDNVGSFLFDTETNVLGKAADSESKTQQLKRSSSSLTVLPSGEVLLSGSSGYTTDATIINPEIYTPGTNQWRTLTGGENVSGDWVLPNGEVLIGNQFYAEYLDVNGSGSVTRGDDVTLRRLLRGNPVMYRPGKFYEAGVSYTGFGPSIVDLDERDFSMRSLSSQRVPDRSPLIGTILLPTGDAMSVTDMNMGAFATPIAPRLEIWNAATESWSLMVDEDSSSSFPPTITLLKDGRVLASRYTSFKTFSPPYLFNSSGELAERPQIVSAPTQGGYNNQIKINHSSENNISRVTLVSQARESSAGFGARVGQRFIELEFDDVTGGVNVSLPDSANIAPPGYYIMYLIDDQGVPSEGHMISLNASSTDTIVFPTASDDYATTTDGSPITIDVLANDMGSNLTLNPPNAWSLKGGNVSLVDNKLTYTPKSGFTGDDNIWYTFVDAIGRVNSGKVTITVNANSSPYPTASEDNVEAITLNSTSINVLANDNGNGLVLHAPNTWSLKGGTVELVDNQLVYTSKADFVGNDNIWYVFEDSQGRTNSGQVNITVTSGSVSAYPVANSDSYTTSKGIGKNLDILDNDTGSGWIGIDTLYEYTANGGTTYKTPEGLVWYTPKAGFTGEDNFWYVMIDSEGRKNSAKVIITVRP